MTALVDIRHKLPPLKSLTALRFVATMYVIAFHIDLSPWVGDVPLLRTFIASGYTGVTLFFILSGFVLAYNYPHIASARNFWAARFARVYPVYALTCLFCIFLPVTWHSPHPLIATALSLSMLQAWWLPLSGALNQNGWTLSVEIFFYLLFPFLMRWFVRMTLATFATLQVLALTIACSPLFLLTTHRASLATGTAAFLISRFPVVWINTFLVGMYLGLQRQRAAVVHREPRHTIRALAAAIAACCFLLCAVVPAAARPLWALLLLYAYAYLIASVANIRSTFLASRAVQTLGEMGYGMYILQFPVAAAFYSVWFRVHPSRTFTRTLFLALLLFTAYASLRWLELPARLWLRRRWSPLPVATMPL